MLISLLLQEDKSDRIAERYNDQLKQRIEHWGYDIDPASFTKNVSKADPTNTKKYLEWIIIQFIKGEIKWNELATLGQYIKKFEDVIHLIPMKDISRYTYSTLKDTADYYEHHVSKRQEKKVTKGKGVEEVTRGPDCIILRIKTIAASMVYGANTRWCTAGREDNKYDTYAEQGSLFYCMCKDGEKFAIQFESGTMVDATDAHVDASSDRIAQYPTIQNFIKQEILDAAEENDLHKCIDILSTIWCGRLPEVEEYIITGGSWGRKRYLEDCVKGRWEAYEQFMINKLGNNFDDSSLIGDCVEYAIEYDVRWPALEQFFLRALKSDEAKYVVYDVVMYIGRALKSVGEVWIEGFNAAMKVNPELVQDKLQSYGVLDKYTVST